MRMRTQVFSRIGRRCAGTIYLHCVARTSRFEATIPELAGGGRCGGSRGTGTYGELTMRVSICILMLLAACSGGAFGQSYEVASIKPNNSGSGGSSTHSNRGEMMMKNVSLKQLVQMAYDVKDYSMSAPDWLGSEHFDIVAKVPKE